MSNALHIVLTLLCSSPVSLMQLLNDMLWTKKMFNGFLVGNGFHLY